MNWRPTRFDHLLPIATGSLLASSSDRIWSAYKAEGAVPYHLGVNAALVHAMEDTGIDYLPKIARIPIEREAPKGESNHVH